MSNTKSIIEEQRSFFKTNTTKELAYRKKYLKALRKAIIAREDELCEALFKDFKKPMFEALASETQFVLSELNHILKHLEYWAQPNRVSGSWANFPSRDYILHEPYGNVLIIAPWNYPIQLALSPLIGALAAGNTVVIKPSELTPNSSKMIAELITSVFPPEYVTVVEGGVEASQELLHEPWNYIFFTGSTRVGQIIYEAAARHLTPVTLELGGKSPCIVDETAKIKTAAKRIAWGKFLNAGQTCIAPDYVLVHASVKEKLVVALKQAMETFYGTTTSALDYARIISEEHYTRVSGYLDGQTILAGGTCIPEERFIAPTLIDEPSLDSNVMQEEIFGPILPIISYNDISEIEQYVLHFNKPLALYLFSENRKFQNRIQKQYSFGGGAINDTVIHITNKKLPFGGVGASGINGYHGKNSFVTFSHQKSMVKRGTWIDLPLRYPPYDLPVRWAKKIKHLF
jgi:aldehyde dehydrogenase (NAD+)